MYEIDEKDKKILELLQKDGRMQLTELSRSIDLSIDSTHKRIKKMIENKIFHPGIFVNPIAIGNPMIANIQIKLHNVTEDDMNKMIGYLKQHKNVIELISIIGDYDLTLVIMSKDANELNDISTQIRQKFKTMIADWRSVINLKVHKFEEYRF